MNGILLIDIKNRQIVSFIENANNIDKIFVIDGEILLNSMKEKKINIIKCDNYIKKYPEIILSNVEKIYFDTESLNICEDLNLENKSLFNNEDTAEELLLINELKGGIIALAKNQRLKLYK